MKKIYSLALAAMATIAVSAATPSNLVTREMPKARMEAKAVVLKKAPAVNNDVKALAVKTAAVSDISIEGEYEITLGDFYRGNNSLGEVKATATVSLNGSSLTISCKALRTDVTGTYDEVNGTITFTNSDLTPIQVTTQGSSDPIDAYMRVEPFLYDTDADEIVPQNITANYADGVIKFPADAGFSWRVYSSTFRPSDVTLLGSLGTYDIIGLVNTSLIVEYPETQCKWKENIIYSNFLGVENTKESEVAVTHNTASNTYILHYGLAPTFQDKFNEPDAAPDVEINFTDPTNGIIELASTNINGGKEDGVYYFCSTSYLQEDETPEVQRITCVEDDNTITITLPVNSTILYASTAKQIYKASFYPSTLVINKIAQDGIGSIATDSNEAPAVYYNLQGMKVAQPAEGGVYIVKKGNKVSKQVIR